MREFEMDGITYRTNADASRVEARDPHGWHVTGSLRVILHAQTLVAPAPAPAVEYHDPQFCPYCGGRNILNVNGWAVHAHDDKENTADVDE